MGHITLYLRVSPSDELLKYSTWNSKMQVGVVCNAGECNVQLILWEYELVKDQSNTIECLAFWFVDDYCECKPQSKLSPLKWKETSAKEDGDLGIRGMKTIYAACFPVKISHSMARPPDLTTRMRVPLHVPADESRFRNKITGASTLRFSSREGKLRTSTALRYY